MGWNSLLEYEPGVPRITKDGVTVVKNIEFLDKSLNQIMSVLKQVSHNTNQVCGDGTTSSSIIASEIIKNGSKFLNDRAGFIEI